MTAFFHTTYRRIASACALLCAAACTPSWEGYTPEMFELANIKDSNVVPKSAPRTFVAAFDTHCVAKMNAFDSIPEGLRAANYVQMPRVVPAQATQTRVQMYAVDDKRPLVMLSSDGAPPVCAVAAASRTGQTAAVDRYVAATFPNATALDPARIGKTTERAWLTGTNPNRLVTTTRKGRPNEPASVMLMIMNAADAKT